MLPVLSFLLAPRDFGILAVFSSLTSLLLTVLSLNVYTSITRYYFEENSDIASFLSSVFASVLVITAGLFPFVMYFKEEIAVFMKLPVNLVFYILPLLVLFSLRSIYSQFFRAREKSRILSRVNIYYAVFYAFIVILYLVLANKKSYIVVIWASVTVQSILAVYILFNLKSYLKIAGVKTEHIKYALAYGIPLIPYTLSTQLLTSFDVLLVNKYLGAEQAGFYSIAYKIGSLLLIFIIALNSAWTPKYMRYMNKKDYASHIEYSVKITKSTLLAALIIICYGDIFASAITPDVYNEGFVVVAPVVVGYVFYLMFVIYNKHTTYFKKMIYQSAVAVIGGGVNIVLNIIYVPRYGIIAAAYTTLFSFVLMAILSWIINRELLKIESVPIGKMLAIIAPMVFVLVIKQVLFSYHLTFIVDFMLNTILLLVTVMVIFKGRIHAIKNLVS
jgi:O-antigen/teichoic acid export membrane protein